MSETTLELFAEDLPSERAFKMAKAAFAGMHTNDAMLAVAAFNITGMLENYEKLDAAKRGSK